MATLSERSKPHGLPHERAETYVREAALALCNARKHAHVERLLALALSEREAIEKYHDHHGHRDEFDFLTENERQAHLGFIGVLIWACELYWKVGRREEARKCYEAALAWATDPNCSSWEHLQEAEELWGKLNRPWWKRLADAAVLFYR